MSAETGLRSRSARDIEAASEFLGEGIRDVGLFVGAAGFDGVLAYEQRDGIFEEMTTMYTFD